MKYIEKLKFFLFRVLNLKAEEGSRIGLLFFHSFFLGLFIAFYFVPANSVFIEHFGTESLPYAYIVAGIMGYIISAIYSYLQNKVNFRWLILGALSFMFIVPLLARFMLYFINAGFTTIISKKWLSFFVFIWAWPFISLVGIEIGGLALRYMNLRQVKRHFGLVNAGGVTASIIGYLTIPLFVKFLGNTYDLLYIGAIGIVISIILLIYLFREHPEESESKESQQKESDTRFIDLLKERYFVFIFLSATLSMIVIYIADFGFLAAIKAKQELITISEGLSNILRFGDLTIEVSSFIALVFGVLKVGELIMSFSASRILSKYGVKLGLKALPYTLTVLILLALIVGLTLGQTSLLFLIIMVLNKSIERILRRSLDDTSFNVLYQALPSKQQFAVQTQVGVVMQISIALAGGLLLLCTYLLKSDNGQLDLTYFTLFFMPLILAWAIVATQLYNAYKAKLRQILAELSKTQKRDKYKHVYGDELLRTRLRDDNENIVRMSITLLAETDPYVMQPFASSIVKKGQDEGRKILLTIIDPTYQRLDDTIAKIIKKEKNPEIKELAEKAYLMLDYSQINDITESEETELLKSENFYDKITLIKYLFINKIEKDIPYIESLLNDKNKLIRRTAIRLAGNKNDPKLNLQLVDILGDTEFRNIVANILLEVSQDVLPELEKYFLKKDSPVSLLLKIIEIYAKAGTSVAKSLLVNHLNFPNQDVQLAVVRALNFCRYQASNTELPIIKQKLSETAENLLWNFVTIADLETEKNTLKLIQSIELERDNNFEILFNLLSFAYKPTTIALIRKNIIGENTIFAFEIIENFISQDIKQLIIPLFDNISVSQRIKKLSAYFKMKPLKLSDRLKDIIVRDYNKTGIWTKTKAIELLGKIYRNKQADQIDQSLTGAYREIEIWTQEKVEETLRFIRKSDIPDEIFACLHHPDELIYTTAAKIIYDENPIRCVNYLKRLSPKKQNLGDLFSQKDKEHQLLTERMRYLKRHPLFFSVPEYTLVKLAAIVTAVNLPKDETIEMLQNGQETVIILLRGVLACNLAEEEIKFKKDEILLRGDNVPECVQQLTAIKDSTLLVAFKYEYFNLLFDETDILTHMLDMV